MAGYSETFLGDVHTWEIDATEHLTVAFYYEKLEAATWRFLRQAGVDPFAARTTDAVTHYKAELRNRDIYRIETGLIRAGDNPMIAHRVFNAETATLCTTMQQSLAGVSLPGPVLEWDGDAVEGRSVPGADAGWCPTLMDMVRPTEADWAGNLALPGYIHRFSTANSFIQAAFGMTPEYMTENRFGFSTFEFQLTFHAAVKPGAMINIESCLAQLGGSSLRLYHRMRDAESGDDIAGLSQFGVNLDLDTRRPARVADDIRARAQAMFTLE